jgi:hypothetical protein
MSGTEGAGPLATKGLSLTCRECWDDPCTCEPAPLEDFQNGYDCELAEESPRMWCERANAHGLTLALFFRTVFPDDCPGMPDLGWNLLMRRSPIMEQLERKTKAARELAEFAVRHVGPVPQPTRKERRTMAALKRRATPR